MTEAHGPDSPENPHAGQGSVLLDIGGDIGALVVTMPADLAGVEVEVLGEHEQPSGPSEHGHHHHDGHGHDHDHGHDHAHGHGHAGPRHVAVVRRPVPGGEVPSLVYPELEQGHYRLVLKGSTSTVLEVDVRGGEVTTADWPEVAVLAEARAG